MRVKVSGQQLRNVRPQPVISTIQFLDLLTRIPMLQDARLRKHPRLLVSADAPQRLQQLVIIRIG